MTSTLGTGPVSAQYLAEYRGDTLLSICGVAIVLETVFVTLRFYARYLTTSGFRWDDALMLAAWLANATHPVIAAVHGAGVGRHLEAVLATHPERFVAWAKSVYALEWLYHTSVALPRGSIIFLYLWIFPGSGTRSMCYALLCAICATWFSFMIVAALQCMPLAYQWDKTIPNGHCIDVDAAYKAVSIPNIVIDVVMLITPLPSIAKIQISIARKFGLFLGFLVGSVGLVGSCVRMSEFFKRDAFTDSTWASVPLMAWSVIEPGMYLIAACLLIFRPIPHLLSTKDFRSRLGSVRAFYRGRSDDGQDLHRRSKPKSSLSGFTELQDWRDKAAADGKVSVPRRAVTADLSSNRHDMEQTLGISTDHARVPH